MILELCKGVHCVDLGERCQTHIYLQNVASMQPRTSPGKFARSGRAGPNSSRRVPAPGRPASFVPRVVRRGGGQSTEPDLSAESTPTGAGCQMKEASIFSGPFFTEKLPIFYQNFTNVHSFR